jgi:hypothetical protein
MAVATAMPVTSDKVTMPGEMAAVESTTMEPSPVKPSATMASATVASAAVGECSWSHRQHSGKDQSDNLNSAHYTNPFSPNRRAARPGTIIGFADSVSAEVMAIGRSAYSSVVPRLRDYEGQVALAWLCFRRRAVALKGVG